MLSKGETMPTLNNPTAETQTYAAMIGLDWADKKHFYTMRTSDGQLERGQLDNTPEAVEIWAAGLNVRFGGQPVAVALEQARGAVIAMFRLPDPEGISLALYTRV